MIELKCLGPPSVTVRGSKAPRSLLWRKNFALLVYLALSPRGRTRDHLMALFWPESDQGKARHSLNEALRVLRRTLGDALIAEGDVVRLAEGAVTTDLETPEPDGLFLEGFSLKDAPEFEEWLLRERERLRARSAGRLVESAEHALAQGQTSRAREIAERILKIDPYNEEALRILLRAMALEGARSLALERFERFREAMERELGASCDPETGALAARIRRGEVRAASAPGVIEPGTPPVPLVGRARGVLEALLAEWKSACAGGARILLVMGDPGTGKTRLLDELAARARLDGAIVAYTRAHGGDPVESVVAGWLRGGLAVAELGGAPAAAIVGLAAVDPDLMAKFPGSKSAEPLELSQALIAAVLAAAESRPVLVVLDDAHRSHLAVPGLLSRLAEQGRGARIAIALASGPNPPPAVDQVRQRLGRELPGVELRTHSFCREDLLELVSWVLPHYAPEQVARLARRVMSDTGGNPFLAVEMVRAVQHGLSLREDSIGGRQAAEWPAPRKTLDDTLPAELPGSVVAALRLRYRAVSDSAQRVLSALAVLEGRSSFGLLARATGLPVSNLEQALDELEWERWIVADPGGYAFVTRLAREVILSEMVTAGEQRRIRERAGLGPGPSG
ncbi:MAG: hypothetical protein KatS3mg081_2782 [Gemmatimonadales bacterium]|nr:MAG: hypothetical protein KatS3mg081_2782 [Gemmatimonadales bacterium]